MTALARGCRRDRASRVRNPRCSFDYCHFISRLAECGISRSARPRISTRTVWVFDFWVELDWGPMSNRSYPVWITRGHWTRQMSCLFYPRKRTRAGVGV